MAHGGASFWRKISHQAPDFNRAFLVWAPLKRLAILNISESGVSLVREEQ